MRGALLPVFAAGITPILVLTLVWLTLTPGLVEWQAPILWTRQVAGPVENGNVDSMAADSSYVYAAGHVWVGYNKPGGPSYYFLDKYDRNGNQIWDQRFGTPGATDFAPGGGAALDDFVAGTSVDGGSVYVALSFNLTSLLRKYDTDGNFQWVRPFGNLSSHAWDLSHYNAAPYLASVSAGANRVFMVGTAFLNGTYVGEVAGYDSDGTLLWASNLGSDALYYPRSVPYPLSVYADSEAVYVAVNLDNGSYVRKLDSNGVIQWSHRSDYFLDAVSGDASGIYLSAEAGFSIVLSKLNPNGSVVWNFKTEAPDGKPNYDRTMVSASSSGVYVTENGFVVKYDVNGNRVWYVHPSGLYLVSASPDGVYAAGALYLLMVGGSSSLIIFGVGPPYSFIMVAVLGGVVAASILWVRRLWKKRIQSHPTSADVMRYGQTTYSRTPKNKF